MTGRLYTLVAHRQLPGHIIWRQDLINQSESPSDGTRGRDPESTSANCWIQTNERVDMISVKTETWAAGHELGTR